MKGLSYWKRKWCRDFSWASEEIVENEKKFKTKNEGASKINEENSLEIFIEGLNIIERNLRSNDEFSNFNQLKHLVNEYFKLGEENSSQTIFAFHKKLETYFYKNLIVKPKLIINQVPQNQYPVTNQNLSPSQDRPIVDNRNI